VLAYRWHVSVPITLRSTTALRWEKRRREKMSEKKIVGPASLVSSSVADVADVADRADVAKKMLSFATALAKFRLEGAVQVSVYDLNESLLITVRFVDKYWFFVEEFEFIERRHKFGESIKPWNDRYEAFVKNVVSETITFVIK
jgi:hypothetical protein